MTTDQPAPSAGQGTERLRDDAGELWHELINEDDQGAVEKLRQIIAERDEARATVQRLRDLLRVLDRINVGYVPQALREAMDAARRALDGDT